MKIAPTPMYDADKVKSLRLELKLAQAAFAGVCGVSVKTVEAWESGRNIPNGSTSRLLEILQKDPAIVIRTGILCVS